MPYLTVKQAAGATGKSEKTIRRLCNLPKSKDYVTYEENKLLIDANYLQQNYPMLTTGQPRQNSQKPHKQKIDTPTQMSIDTVQAQETHNLLHEIELLKLQLKHKEEVIHIKDRQLEVLERSLLLLGEGIKKEPVSTLNEEEQPEQQPSRKKRWWFW